MRGPKRRLRRLESQITATLPGLHWSQDQDQDQDQDQANPFEAASQPPVPARAVPAGPMPRELIVAARQAGETEFSVVLDLVGATAAVIISGEGDPREWWTAVWTIAGPEVGVTSEPDIRIDALPAGLSVVAVSRASGELTVSVAAEIEPGRQLPAALAAVRAVLSETRSSSRRPGRSSGGAPRARAAAAIGAAVLLTTAVTGILALAEHHQSRTVRLSDPSTAPTPGRDVPAGRAGHTAPPATASGTSRARAGHNTAPAGHRGTGPRPSASGRPTARPGPSATPSPPTSSGPLPIPPLPTTSSAPDPTATPTPSPTSSNGCVTFLGIRMCL